MEANFQCIVHVFSIAVGLEWSDCFSIHEYRFKLGIYFQKSQNWWSLSKKIMKFVYTGEILLLLTSTQHNFEENENHLPKPHNIAQPGGILFIQSSIDRDSTGSWIGCACEYAMSGPTRATIHRNNRAIFIVTWIWVCKIKKKMIRMSKNFRNFQLFNCLYLKIHWVVIWLVMSYAFYCMSLMIFLAFYM